jgi:AcrR family transcriptional regulator
MPSILSSSVRVAPQQERSARRLAGFLAAAAKLFAEVGFEATTMQAIADRSQSSIGALYNYFPDKQSVAVTLLVTYSDELWSCLESLLKESRKPAAARFAGLFIDRIVEFARERPAWLSLYAAPVLFRGDPATRRALRSTIANAFRKQNPSLSSERAFLAANVTMQIVKGMNALYSESDAKTRPLIEAEFRKVLTSYLEEVLSEKRQIRDRL